MKVTEVTQAEWQARMAVNPASNKGCGTDCPVESVTWFEDIAFANRLSIEEGRPPCFQRREGRLYDLAAAAAFEIPA